MAAEHTREMQAGEKRAAAPSAEQTRAGEMFTPVVDIFETETALTVVADLPGVKAQDLTIDQAQITAQLSDGVLRLTLPKVEQAKPRQIPVQAG